MHPQASFLGPGYGALARAFDIIHNEVINLIEVVKAGK